MPPTSTLDPDKIGPIQPFPYKGALKECVDITSTGNRYWIFNEDDQKVMRIVIELHQEKAAEELYLGIRIVYFNHINYTTMSMTNQRHNHSPEAAYDRAMSIVGKR